MISRAPASCIIVKNSEKDGTVGKYFRILFRGQEKSRIGPGDCNMKCAQVQNGFMGGCEEDCGVYWGKSNIPIVRLHMSVEEVLDDSMGERGIDGGGKKTQIHIIL